MEKSNAKVKRIADANLNRLREGLRVAEDISRFILDDKEISGKIKNIRSEVSLIQKRYNDFILFRDTKNDVGKTINSNIEKVRNSIEDIVYANLKRIEESLRVLEELFKMINIDDSLQFKKLRYESYILEQDIILKLKKMAV